MPYLKKNAAANLRTQICALYNANGDWRNLANVLQVPKRTAYRWVNNQEQPEKQRGGKRRAKITDEHRQFMERSVEENPKITLKGLSEKIREDFALNVSNECVRQHLNGLMFTLKTARREPENANSIQTKTSRSIYVENLLDLQAQNIPIIYMDETNFNLFISRTQGRSKKGTRCTTVSAGCRGSNIHLIGCIGNMGLIHSELRRGSFKKPEANEFVRQCLRRAQGLYQTGVALVIDNAPCHSTIEEVFAENEFEHHTLLRLSPYSPMFNPIEQAWSALKAGVKADMAVQLNNILAGADRDHLTQTEYRMQKLENTVHNNMDKITVANCAMFIAHIQRFIPSALNMQDINF